jgi:replicative DNA helicase
MSGFNVDAPNAASSEIALLSALLTSETAMQDAGHLLSATDFHMPQHAAIFSAMQRMARRNCPVNDHELVINELSDSGQLDAAGGRAFIVHIVNERANAATAEHHARAVLEKSQRRRMQTVAELIAQAALDPAQDTAGALAAAMAALTETSDRGVTKAHAVTMADGLELLWQKVEHISNGGAVPARLPSRFGDGKAILRGYLNSSVYTLAGRPGGGKSSFMHAESVFHARQFLQEHTAAPVGDRQPLKHAVIYSLEMPVYQVYEAIAAMEVRLPFSTIEDGKLTPTQARQLLTGINDLSKLPLVVIDNLVYFEDIEADIRRRARAGTLGTVYIDQLNLLDTRAGYRGNDSERLKINHVMRQYKRLAMATGRPLFMLHQVNRAGDGEPRLVHLKESGMVEESSDAVIFINRDLEEAETMQPGEIQETQIIVAKNRHGRLGRFTIGFNGQFKAFVSVTRNAQNGNGKS